MASAYISEIRAFAGTFVPAGWLACNGQLVSIQEYEPLYVLVGTTYGGDGVNTFGLPNLSGRQAIGQGQSTAPGSTNHPLGSQGGAETVTLTTAQLPAHSHSAVVSTVTEPASINAPAYNTYMGAVNSSGGDGVGYVPAGNTVIPKVMSAKTISATGASQPHENMMPSLAVTYIICYQGIFPTQG